MQKNLDIKIKLLGFAEHLGKSIYQRVHPTLKKQILMSLQLTVY